MKIGERLVVFAKKIPERESPSQVRQRNSDLLNTVEVGYSYCIPVRGTVHSCPSTMLTCTIVDNGEQCDSIIALEAAQTRPLLPRKHAHL